MRTHTPHHPRRLDRQPASAVRAAPRAEALYAHSGERLRAILAGAGAQRRAVNGADLDDAYEREADRVADAIVAAPAATPANGSYEARNVSAAPLSRQRQAAPEAGTERSDDWRTPRRRWAVQQIAKIDAALLGGLIWSFEQKKITGQTQAQVIRNGERDQMLRNSAWVLRDYHDAFDQVSEETLLERFQRAAWIDSDDKGNPSAVDLVAEFFHYYHDQGLDWSVRVWDGCLLVDYLLHEPERTAVLPPTEDVSTGWWAHLLDPRARPTEPWNLVDRFAASYDLYESKTDAHFEVFRDRETGGYYYLDHARQRVYLPGLDERFPRVGAPPPSAQEPEKPYLPIPIRRKRDLQGTEEGVGEELAPSTLGAGRALDPDVRHFFEARLGRDLGTVRIHDDGRAARSAKAAGALAYTVGSRIVFGAGRFQPDTSEGRRLLAHELVHTIQQEGSSAGVRMKQPEPGTTSRAGLLAEDVRAPVARRPLALTRDGETAFLADWRTHPRREHIAAHEAVHRMQFHARGVRPAGTIADLEADADRGATALAGGGVHSPAFSAPGGLVLAYDEERVVVLQPADLGLVEVHGFGVIPPEHREIHLVFLEGLADEEDRAAHELSRAGLGAQVWAWAWRPRGRARSNLASYRDALARARDEDFILPAMVANQLVAFPGLFKYIPKSGADLAVLRTMERVGAYLDLWAAVNAFAGLAGGVAARSQQGSAMRSMPGGGHVLGKNVPSYQAAPPPGPVMRSAPREEIPGLVSKTHGPTPAMRTGTAAERDLTRSIRSSLSSEPSVGLTHLDDGVIFHLRLQRPDKVRVSGSSEADSYVRDAAGAISVEIKSYYRVLANDPTQAGRARRDLVRTLGRQVVRRADVNLPPGVTQSIIIDLRAFRGSQAQRVALAAQLKAAILEGLGGRVPAHEIYFWFGNLEP